MQNEEGKNPLQRKMTTERQRHEPFSSNSSSTNASMSEMGKSTMADTLISDRPSSLFQVSFPDTKKKHTQWANRVETVKRRTLLFVESRTKHPNLVQTCRGRLLPSRIKMKVFRSRYLLREEGKSTTTWGEYISKNSKNITQTRNITIK